MITDIDYNARDHNEDTVVDEKEIKFGTNWINYWKQTQVHLKLYPASRTHIAQFFFSSQKHFSYQFSREG